MTTWIATIAGKCGKQLRPALRVFDVIGEVMEEQEPPGDVAVAVLSPGYPLEWRMISKQGELVARQVLL